jgi:lipoyl(octanoyl) transferase
LTIHPENDGRRACDLYDLGVVGYHEGFNLQKRLQKARIDGEIGDTILLLQHNPVITVGMSGNRGNIIASEDFLKEAGVEIVQSNRGGDITFHNQGQLVAYFIFHLTEMKLSVYQCVRALEEVVIRLLSHFGITASRDPSHPGVWVGNDKICALGLNVSHGVTMHGFALNVNNDLTIASYIYPCGIRDKGVVSMSKILSRVVAVEELIRPLFDDLEATLSIDINYGTADCSAVSWMETKGAK